MHGIEKVQVLRTYRKVKALFIKKIYVHVIEGSYSTLINAVPVPVILVIDTQCIEF